MMVGEPLFGCLLAEISDAAGRNDADNRQNAGISGMGARTGWKTRASVIFEDAYNHLWQ